MKTDLNQFYHQRPWQKLLETIKAERTDENGFLICEHCGKPITKKFDCIGHHKIQLTEENVNDVMIALNPENIALVHHKCHSKIHDHLGHKRKEIYLIYGSPCSGKSTYLDSIIEPGDLIVDVDRIRSCINGQKMHVSTPRLNNIMFGIRDYLIDSVATRNGRWDKCYIVGGYPFAAERERLCQRTGAVEIYIDSTKEECLERLRMDPNGRDIKEWERYIDEWWRRFSPAET